MKYEKSELDEAYAKLLGQQSTLGVIFGSLIGLAVGETIFVFLSKMEGILIAFIFIPAWVIGKFAGYTGRAFKLSYRIIPGVCAFALHALFCVLAEAYLLLLLAPLSAGVAIYFAKRPMTDLEKAAVWTRDLEMRRKNSGVSALEKV